MAISGTYSEGDEVVFRDCELEVDLTPVSASAFAEVTTWTSEVSVSGGDVPTSRLYLFQATGPVIFEGNRNPYRVVVTSIYTEGANDPFTEIWKKHEDPATNFASDLRAMNVRYSPKGGNSGNAQFTTGGGKLVDVTPPQNSAEATDATRFSFTVEAGTLARTIVTP